MAEFFDDRQEVLDLELTQWGKYLLSVGKFKPVKYAFFDDDILYDLAALSGSTEEQKAATQRILNETPRLKTQTRRREAKNYLREYAQASSGIPLYADPLDSMTNISISKKVRQERGLSGQDSIEKEMILSKKVGTARTQQDKSPAFNVRLLKNSISASQDYLISNFGTQEIPQIDVDIEYRVTIGNTFDGTSNIVEDINLRSGVARDGTYVAVESDFVVLDIMEGNTEYQNSNFTVELLEVEDQNGLEYRGLTFQSPNDGIDENGFLLDYDTVNKNFFQQPKPEAGDVGYYFNILTSIIFRHFTYF